jgi:hypothetical protein
MGLPEGWITDIPIPRGAQLRALGNCVVPQQAASALSLLLSSDHRESVPPDTLAGNGRCYSKNGKLCQ